MGRSGCSNTVLELSDARLGNFRPSVDKKFNVCVRVNLKKVVGAPETARAGTHEVGVSGDSIKVFSSSILVFVRKIVDFFRRDGRHVGFFHVWKHVRASKLFGLDRCKSFIK